MKTTRYILFTVLMLLLILPAVQRFAGFIRESPLKGAITLPEKPVLNSKSWFDGSFQENYDPYLEQTVGFRPTLIRINNQIAFSVFDTALANGVIIGKNNYLYENNYVKAYEGVDFVGYKEINEQVAKAKIIQRKLEENGQHFLIVFAPGKGSYFPEYIPEKYRVKNRGITNYDCYASRFLQEGIPFIDFNRWFIQMKDTSRYPLYSKTGIHWSLYGVALSVDSLVRYMEKMAGIDMVDFSWDGIEVSSDPRDTDNDIANGMNLLFPIKTGEMAYPNIRFNDPPGKTRPDVLVIGDSYYWNIMGSGIASRLFGDNNFWFYNREAHNPKWREPKKVSDLNILDEIKKQQFVILLFTDANLYKFPCGFFNDVTDAWEHPEQSIAISPEVKEKRIKEIIADMRKSKETVEMIRQKAIKKKISFEEMLRLDANWILEQNKSK